jgi:hypothetical protein
MLVNTHIAYIHNKGKLYACQWLSISALWNLIPAMLANARTLIVSVLYFKVQHVQFVKLSLV